MLGIRLVRLFETHSVKLSRGLTAQILKSERTSDFRKIPAEELEHAIRELYRHLGDWLLHKTEGDVEERFRAVAALRAAEGVRLHQLISAILLSRDQLWQFLRQQSFADNVVALYGEMELMRMLNAFYDRAIYYSVRGYEEAKLGHSKGQLERVRNFAESIGLISSRDSTVSEQGSPYFP